MAREPLDHVLDHTFSAERLTAGHAMKRLRFMNYNWRTGLLRQQVSRRKADRIFGTGLHAQTTLHTVAFNEPKLRMLRTIEQRALRAGSDAGLAHRAGGRIHNDFPERSTGR